MPITWIQRLGYILDLVKQAAAADHIRTYVHEHARGYTMLAPGHESADSRRVPNWKLVVNAELEPDI